jgi:hypothetical protein
MQADETTVVMDVKPFPTGQGFAGGDKWWDYVLSGSEKDRLDSLIAAAMLDDSICEGLLNGVDASVLSTFGLSETTITLLQHIQATTLSEFAQHVITMLKLDKKPT